MCAHVWQPNQWQNHVKRGQEGYSKLVYIILGRLIIYFFHVQCSISILICHPLSTVVPSNEIINCFMCNIHCYVLHVHHITTEKETVLWHYVIDEWIIHCQCTISILVCDPLWTIIPNNETIFLYYCASQQIFLLHQLTTAQNVSLI